MLWQTISQSTHSKGLHPIIGKLIPGESGLMTSISVEYSSGVLHLAWKGPVRNEPCQPGLPPKFGYIMEQYGKLYVEVQNKYIDVSTL